ncbi:fumarylacetoacetate hydrolase family protein [Capnocytophaga canimorsus]|uniref:fumarylacetoacetate hydrolase family protein n=1 Tax=Capnocytophaga canimorsus TaxID=28188 RepID=UPI000D6DD909|nr:fumarylacetoacetate hydrolase family protein [Capnocytophaga canimorsus]AWL78191.1 fumarylacetoacetate hydrolase family protein [Capnocytophaga canimorsus]AYW36824.1 fumarylacetoacetate hydrolase family protein [Capnocytophaga canimorsus]MDT9499514.1 fumarylacetoacetate hydrolase family protein [Capnocytophaga canimorsus]
MKIICVGKNYANHIQEMGGEKPKDIVLFIKPDTAIHNPELPFYIPDFTADLHHEVELVIKINQNGKHISEKFAHKYYDEIALGIDFTARDLQTQLKKEGLPWEKSKAFDGSAVVSSFLPKAQFAKAIGFSLNKNGVTVQQGNTADMIWNIDQIISQVSKFFTLRKGDFIFTGTPAGVGSVHSGDFLEGFLEGESVFSLRIK